MIRLKHGENVDLIGAPGTTRTCDLRFRKPLLYPLSYGGVGWQLGLQLATALNAI